MKLSVLATNLRKIEAYLDRQEAYLVEAAGHEDEEDEEEDSFNKEVVETFKKKFKGARNLTVKDYENWLDDWSPKFDKAVTAFLGKKRFEEAQAVARAVGYFLYKLGLHGKKSGGIDLSQIDKIK